MANMSYLHGKIEAMAGLSHRRQFQGPSGDSRRIAQSASSLEKGTPATWSEENGRLVLTPMTEQRLDEIMGFLKPKPGEPVHV